MKVMLLCESCERIDVRRFSCHMRDASTPTTKVVVEMESPAVPGRMYELLLKGIYPGYQEPCVSGVLGFDADGKLSPITTQRESDLKEQGYSMYKE